MGERCFWTASTKLILVLQAKLLQLLQDGQFCRIGGQEDITVNTRGDLRDGAAVGTGNRSGNF